MDNNAITQDFTKDGEIYLMLIKLIHKKLSEVCNSYDDSDTDIKELKLYLDIGDKAIQNRLKLLIQLGKLDVETLEEDSANIVMELLEQAKDEEEDTY